MNPCAADISEWAVPGWEAADVLPLARSLSAAGVHCEPAVELNPLSQAFLEACEGAGLPRASALEDASRPLAAPLRLTIKGGKRWTAADAYLRPSLQRGNLTVWTDVHVRRVLYEGGRTSGVEYSRAGSVQNVAVTREIVLCAGAVGSPQLLLLSGIGPHKDLDALQIPVATDLPGVGLNLQDHLAAPVPYFCLEPISLSGAETVTNHWKHRLTGAGPLASNGAEVAAMVQSKSGLAACDLEIVFAAGHFVDHGFASPDGHGFTLIPALLTPRSRGNITLLTANPEDPPSIDPAYLSDEAGTDLERLAEGVRFARRLLEQSALARYRGAPVHGRVQEPEEHVRDCGQTLYHPVGSCRMGSDANSVVDSSLRVHGVVGLRVADASVMPLIPRAHPTAMTLLIAEKAAQLLRN